MILQGFAENGLGAQVRVLGAVLWGSVNSEHSYMLPEDSTEEGEGTGKGPQGGGGCL